MNKTVFITGASGFIGSQLARYLRQAGYSVRLQVRESSSREFLKGLEQETVSTSLEDPAQIVQHLRGVDTVYHVAGRVAGSPDQLEQANVNCSGAVAEACAASPTVPVLVCVSSLAAAGPSTPTRPRQTSDPPSPISSYGASKLQAERMVYRYADRVPITIVRPAIVYGPQDRQFAELFKTIRWIRNNPLAGFHNPPLSMIYIHDLVRMLEKAASSGRRLNPDDASREAADQGIYFAASDAISLREVGYLVRKSLRRPFAPALPIPIHIAFVAAAISQWIASLRNKPTLFNLDKIREAKQPAWTCDHSKSVQELQWQPEYSIDQGFEETVRWYFDNAWL